MRSVKSRSRREDKVETVVHKDHKVITPPATLRKRTMTIGGPGGTDMFDMAALERAEAALGELEKEFSGWMALEIDHLEEARGNFREAPADDEARQILYRAGHDIRGQGKTFGYPLAAVFADGMCDLIEGAEEIDQTVLDLVDGHVDAIRAVVRNEVRDGGDDIARNLVVSLRTARERIIGVDRFVKINVEH